MTIKEFIDKAIEGGWNGHIWTKWMLASPEEPNREIALDCIFLDPKAWKATGKVEGWHKLDKDITIEMELIHGMVMPRWRVRMHRMIDHLCEGGDIESYLKGL